MTNEREKQLSEDELKAAVQSAAAKGDFEAVGDLMKRLGAIKAAKEAERVKALVAVQEALDKELSALLNPYTNEKSVLAPFMGRIEKCGGVGRITIDVAQKLVDVKCGTATTRPPASGGGGRAGRVSEKYGAPLDTVFRQFATPEQIAEVDRLSALGRTDRADSKAYALKAKVVAAAEKAGLITPQG